MAEGAEAEKKLFAAKLAEQAERYDEMRQHMKQYVQTSPKRPLNIEGRNLLSVAYKNAVGTRRASWRVIQSVEMKHEVKGSTELANEAKKYKLEVKKELVDICDEILSLIDTVLIPNCDTAGGEIDSRVFYEKMKGDYYRYMCECSEGEERKKYEQAAYKAYEVATQKAADLPEANAVRLGLALNFSVFHYEIMNDCEKACQMAHSAFDHAVRAMDLTDGNTKEAESATKDSTLIMQLLRDNLNLWVPSDLPDGPPNNLDK